MRVERKSRLGWHRLYLSVPNFVRYSIINNKLLPIGPCAYQQSCLFVMKPISNQPSDLLLQLLSIDFNFLLGNNFNFTLFIPLWSRSDWVKFPITSHPSVNYESFHHFKQWENRIINGIIQPFHNSNHGNESTGSQE